MASEMDEQHAWLSDVEVRPVYIGSSAFNFLGLLGNPARHHVELRSSPEKRPAHANGTAIGQVGATIVSLWLRENMDGRLSGEQSQV